MLKEMLEYLTNQSLKGAKAERLDTGNPRLLAHNIGGTVHTIVIEPPVRGSAVGSINDFVQACERYAITSKDEDEAGLGGSVWLDAVGDGAAIVLVIDDDDTLDRVTLPLEFTQRFVSLKNLGSGFINQAQIVRRLAHDMQGVFPDTFVNALKRIQATQSGSSAGEVSLGRERGTREFQAELVNASELPEYPLGVVQVFYGVEPEICPPQRVQCSLALQLPPKVAETMFQLTPLPNELDNAVLQSLQAIAGELRASLKEYGLPVFIGTP